MTDQKNMLLFLVIALGILLGWEALFGGFVSPPPKTDPQQITDSNRTTGSAPTNATDRALSDAQPVAPTAPKSTPIDPTAQITSGERIRVKNAQLDGSLSLKGGLIDHMTLTGYRTDLAPDSPEIELLWPKQSETPYFVRHGWSGEGTVLPDEDTPWTADGMELTPEKPVTLTWDNGAGVVFKRVIALDENYMFSVTQSVENKSDKSITLSPYALINRTNTPQTAGFYIQHEGPLGVMAGALQEMDYSELEDLYDEGRAAGKPASESGTVDKTVGGWVGITDKYWLSAVIPDQTKPVTMRMFHLRTPGDERSKYRAAFVGEPMVIEPGAGGEFMSHAFVGAKRVTLLDGYGESLNVHNFDLAIDFGWFYFLTKPIFLGLLWISNHVGNMGLAILALTLVIKVILFPLTNKSYKSMSRMKALQPKMMELRERFGDDKMRLNQETMALYKREKVNPMGGCLPILVQIPVFFALYKVLYVNIEMRHAPFFGWIKDLSAADPTNMFDLFGLIPWTTPDYLHVGILPILCGFTMWLQQQLNPKPTEAVHAQMMKWLPLIFTYIFASFASGLVIYWTWNNCLSIAQQWLIMKRMGVKAG